MAIDQLPPDYRICSRPRCQTATRDKSGICDTHRGQRIEPTVCVHCGGPDDHGRDCLPASQGGTQPDAVIIDEVPPSSRSAAWQQQRWTPRRPLSAVFQVDGRPVPWTRTGTAVDDSGAVTRFNDSRYVEWRSHIATAAMRWAGVFTGEVILRVVVAPGGINIAVAEAGPDVPLMVDLVPWFGAFRPKGLRGDLDNYVKAVGDGLQKARMITDDRLIVGISAWFADDHRPWK